MALAGSTPSIGLSVKAPRIIARTCFKATFTVAPRRRLSAPITYFLRHFFYDRRQALCGDKAYFREASHACGSPFIQMAQPLFGKATAPVRAAARHRVRC